jgi:hypothetical protein
MLIEIQSNKGGKMTDTFFTRSGSSPGKSNFPDFICESHPSIFLLRPVSPVAFEWIELNLSPDGQLIGNAVAVEHRYIWSILLGIQDSGLSVVPR